MIVKPNNKSSKSKKEQVSQMFDAIAFRYDFLNHFLSAGIDKYWRKKAISNLVNCEVSRILDIATGTGDLAITTVKMFPSASIVGIDISEKMLEIGHQKIKKLQLNDKIELQSGDSEKIDFSDNYFNAITCAFGVRNFENLSVGLSEMYRVLGSGGRCIILEFSRPKHFPFKQVYYFYFSYILPLFGRLISKDRSAYTYLPESVNAFLDGEKFIEELEKVGFKNCSQKQLTFGIASIYVGNKI